MTTARKHLFIFCTVDFVRFQGRIVIDVMSSHAVYGNFLHANLGFNRKSL